jgi:hypothetical protein
MNEDFFWRWLVLKFAESYFTWFWERYGRSWRDDSEAALITLWVWCYVMVFQLIQSLERPDHEELPTVSDADRAELEGLRESFQRQMPTYDPFAAALGRIQLNSIRQLQNMFKDLQIDPESQLQNMFRDLDIDSVRRLDRYRDL